MEEIKSILIVDDNVDLCSMLENALEDKFTTYMVHDGRAAVQCFENSNFNIVIMDIDMPEMNGIEALEHMKATRPDVPVLLMTGNVQRMATQAMLSLGAACVLAKPFKWSVLFDIIENAFSTSDMVNCRQP